MLSCIKNKVIKYITKHEEVPVFVAEDIFEYIVETVIDTMNGESAYNKVSEIMGDYRLPKWYKWLFALYVFSI